MEAAELFELCERLADGQPSAAATRQLHEVLMLAAAEGCRQQGGVFGNLFAQIDFLGKKLGLTIGQTIDLQTARRHAKTGAPVAPEDWPYDVMAVVRLVSAVFKEDVPGTLLRRLPVDVRQSPKGLRINKTYIRCIVSRVSETHIFADTEDGEIAVDYRTTEQGRDFGYLQKLLIPGMQLNLLDCHLTATEETAADRPAKVVPGQVIVEPDFLIDISSLAACFTNYGHHPLFYTLNRLKERPNTQATLLGNFAGTALDDLISDPATPTAASLQRSFREQALRFCACPDFDARKFKTQAEEQVKNIREAVSLLFPPGSHRSPLLEPSFICERLGVNGRVDLMTADMSLLVEQKSGKNMKIEHQSHDSHGLQLESHYVQLLLYYGVLRYNFGKDDRQTDIRLLYSRYPAAQGLLTVNYYRTLLREALRLRNQIVATELLIARDGFQRILPLLRADIIYKDVQRDAYFHQYVLPEIACLQSQIASLSPLERTYYERMLTFVYREQLAAKLGSSETRLHHSGGCASDLWQMSLQEKLDAGNILRVSNPTQLPGEAGVIKLSIVDDDTPTGGEPQAVRSAPDFRPGDMVWLYRYDGQPDVRSSILYKGTLQELSTDSITIALNNAQHLSLSTLNAPLDRRTLAKQELKSLNSKLSTLNSKWAVEHGGSDVGTGSAIRSLHQFITSAPRRKALLLGQRTPEADVSQRLSRSYHPSYDEVLLKIKQARDYFLLVGPPGTGKTSMALRFMVEEELASHSTFPPSLLLTAYTNRAVDEISAMLCEARLPFLRLGKAASCDARYRPYLLDTALANTRKLDDARRLIADTPLIVATTSMLQAQPWVLELKHFSLAIVDEASQILEPSVIGLLGSPAVARFVLIGDHKQLPAVVQQSSEQSVVTEQCLRDICLEDCRHSLFERLLRQEYRQGRTQFVGTLHTHGRMHPDVARFPLSHFYQREALQPVPLPHQQESSLGYDLPAEDQLDELLKSRRLLFLPNDGDEQQEARMTADLLRRIRRFTASHFNPAKTVGVIVPYRRQIALIRQALAEIPELSTEQESITIDTVERYQGSQRDVIIYSFAITHRYQLDFLTATTFTDDDGTLIDRKLNVALTRARCQTIITGRPDLLERNELFRQLKCNPNW